MANQNAIKSMNSRHYKILEFCLRGLTNIQIADKVKMTSQMVSIVVNSPSFEFELSRRRAVLEDMVDEQIVHELDDVAEMIKDGAKAAVEKIIGGISSGDESIALRSSIEILDRAGYPKVNRIESTNLSVVITSEDAKRIQSTIVLDNLDDGDEDA